MRERALKRSYRNNERARQTERQRQKEKRGRVRNKREREKEREERKREHQREAIEMKKERDRVRHIVRVINSNTHRPNGLKFSFLNTGRDRPMTYHNTSFCPYKAMTMRLNHSTDKSQKKTKQTNNMR